MSLLLFIIELIIALYIRDKIIRPYVGDLLVVILIYCTIKSFFKTPILPTALGVLLFSYFMEFLQGIHLVEHLGLSNSKLAVTIIGSSFEWTDLLAYTLGIGIVVVLEKGFSET